ncbi:hypothetical protein Pst134EB_030734 [Puccinia striiformis f. sp. tritici]|nr:hypothetical protein Pst134EB_030734 [Puccinia striiformis f. sp. tritici]
MKKNILNPENRRSARLIWESIMDHCASTDQSNRAATYEDFDSLKVSNKGNGKGAQDAGLFCGVKVNSNN